MIITRLVVLFGFLIGLVMTASAVIPPPPVNQNLGIPDHEFSTLAENDCRFCHNQNPPNGIPTDPTYLPDRHHLRVGSALPVGACNKPVTPGVCDVGGTNLCTAGIVGASCSENSDCNLLLACATDQECRDASGLFDDYCTGESDAPKLDANSDGNVDTNYDCLNCHTIEFDPGTGTFVVVDDFRDCTSCHNVDFQPDHTDRAQEPNVHHRTTEALIDRNCSLCHGSLVDAGFLDNDNDGVANHADPDDTWIPTYKPSLVTPWPSEKAFGSCVVTGACDVGASDVCITGDVGSACSADADCDVDTLNFCAGDEGNYCSAGETCVQDAATYGGGGAANARGHEEGNCNHCHDASKDPNVVTCDGYDPNFPDVAGVCSDTGNSCFKSADCYGPILINHDTHHFTGLTAAGCNTCHYPDSNPFARPTHTALDIRGCERCHGIPSLHNVQVDSDNVNNVGVIVVGAENPYYGHIGSQTDCNGCHGNDAPSLASQPLAPLSGPVVPYLNTADDLAVDAGTATTLALTGVAFTNTTMGIPFESTVELTAADGSATNLAPVSIDESTMTVTIPETLAAGQYYLRAAKALKRSNPMVLAVTPNASIDTAACVNGTVTISGSGFGSYLDASNSGTNVEATFDSVNATAAVSSWTDSEILAVFSGCPTCVTVNSVFDSATTCDGSGGDTDGDGISDSSDNCILIANPTQCDTDGDGFGNGCDADFNNNGVVDPADFSILKSAFGSNDAPDQDLNCNGIVDPADFSLLKSSFGLPSGPSALVQ